MAEVMAPMETEQGLQEKLSAYLKPQQIKQVIKACKFATDAHSGQFRNSGDPYVTHPLAVVDILCYMHMDVDSLIAAMLHDVIEDSGVTKSRIITEFNETVAELVDGVSKLDKIEQLGTVKQREAENFQKMAMAMTRDIRVIIIKLADRLHNMRTLAHINREKQLRIARETLEIYAPIAQRLGMHDMQVELEDLAFRTLYKMRAQLIASAVEKGRGGRMRIVMEIEKAICKRLQERQIRAGVKGREKHLYSIYRKLRDRKKSFEDLMDVYAFRIVVDDVDTCYRALGMLHDLYKPIEGRFKDYIAIPKSNGYQSLHTGVVGAHGLPVEIQIRTPEMEKMANHGIAAHWLYKSNDGGANGGLSRARVRQWITDLLEIQTQAGNPVEFVEGVKDGLFPEEVYVFTPEAEIIKLPHGATPLDFAFAVHTDLGCQAVSCRINRRLAPLSVPLESGQTVEISTSEKAQPDPSWLNFVVTAKARSNIRHLLKQQRLSASRRLGKRILEQSLMGFGISLRDLSPTRLKRVLKALGVRSLNKLLEDIGLGDRTADLVAEQFRIFAPRGAYKPVGGPLKISGTEGLAIHFAACCHPLPGDPILGHISKGRGMVIHHERCRNITAVRRKDATQIMAAVTWDDPSGARFAAEIRVLVENRSGALAIMASTITETDTDIESLRTDKQDEDFMQVWTVVKVRDRDHLARVMRRLRALRLVQSVVRVRNKESQRKLH